MQRLCLVRWFYLAVEIIVAMMAIYDRNILPIGAVATIILLHLTLNFVALYLIKHPHNSFLRFNQASIVVDIFTLSMMFFFMGGISNGAVSIILLPVALAATSFSRRFAWVCAGLSCMTYTLLLKFYWPGGQQSTHHFQHQFESHMFGMWLSFVISAGIVVWFITRQRRQIRMQELDNQRLRETQLRDEKLIAIATLSANSAHAMGTPLTSATMLAEEINEDGWTHELHQQLMTQLQVCRQQVSKLVEVAQGQSLETIETDLSTFLEHSIQQWQVTRPEVKVKCEFKAQAMIAMNENIKFAIMNLIDNAAKASLENRYDEISLSTVLDVSQSVAIEIRHEGKRFDDEILPVIGKQPVSSDSFGIGHLLANVTIEQAGGKVWLQNLTQGALTKICLPTIPEARG